MQEGVERVLQACLRFIAVCRLLQQQEGVDQDGGDLDEYGYGDQGSYSASSQSPRSQLRERARRLPVIVPPEELEAVRKEYFSQVAYLLQVMRKVENRGFIFRLDFNGFMSQLAEDSTQLAV